VHDVRVPGRRGLLEDALDRLRPDEPLVVLERMKARVATLIFGMYDACGRARLTCPAAHHPLSIFGLNDFGKCDLIPSFHFTQPGTPHVLEVMEVRDEFQPRSLSGRGL
jgi:hypothetical protein